MKFTVLQAAGVFGGYKMHGLTMSAYEPTAVPTFNYGWDTAPTHGSMRTLTVSEIDMVDGAVSNDAIFGAAIGVATALAIGMTLPVSGTLVVAFWAGSLISSAIAYNVQ